MRLQSAPAATATPQLDLEARLAAVDALMTVRLDEAHMRLAVDTAHPESPTPEIIAPVRLTPAAAPCPYPTPIAALLYRARVRLEDTGWCTGRLRAPDGAACLIGAIRAEAVSRDQADDACVILLEAIRRDFPAAETVPFWNDSQTSPAPILLALGRAADLAHTRSL